MRFVPLKQEEQQASGVVFRARDLLVHQRTQIARVEDPAETLPPAARTIMLVLVSTLRTLDQQIAVLDAEIASRARHDPSHAT